MVSVTKNEGFLLQGVSQQDKQVRQPGQVSESINRVPDPVLGNISRPGATFVGSNTGTGHVNSKFMHIKVDNEFLLIEYNRSSAPGMALYDLQGNSLPLAFGGGASAYLGEDMRALVYDDYAFILNRDKVVVKNNSVQSDTLRNEAVIWLSGANYFREYVIIIKDNTGTYRAKTETQDGEEDAFVERIASRLEDALNAISELSSYTILRSENYIRIRHPTRTFTVKVTDGDSGVMLHHVQRNVKTLADLPPIAPHNMFVTVTGEKSSDDDIFLRFEAYPDAGSTDFGTPGVWKEVSTVFEPWQLSAQSMPHYLSWDAELQSYIIKPYPWAPREAGNDDTNKFPSFVGTTIRDMREFQSRLVFASPNTVVMSETEHPENFFLKSANQRVATDRIDVRSSKEGSISIEWLVPFDRDLIVLARDAQLLISSAAITPDNAGMVVTTSYDMSPKATPASTGRTLLLPYVSEEGIGYSGINEFFTSDQNATNSNDPLTKIVPRYMRGEIIQMESSPNYGWVTMRTDHSEYQNTLFFYKYLWESTEKVQSAWGKLVFPHPVRYFFFDAGKMYLILQKSDTELLIWRLVMYSTEDVGLPYHVTLDGKKRITLADNRIVMDRNDYRFVALSGADTAGNEVQPTTVTAVSGGWEYYFEYTSATAEFVAGITIERMIAPTMPVARDYQGKPVHNKDLVVDMFSIKYSRSGDVSALMQCSYRPQETPLYKSWFPLSTDMEDPSGNEPRTGVFTIGFGEATSIGSLILRSSDFRPDTIHDMSWTGQMTRMMLNG